MAELWTRDYISPTGDESMNFTATRKIAYNGKDETSFTTAEATAILNAAGKDINDYELDARGSLTLHKDEVTKLLIAGGSEFVRELDTAGFNAAR